MLTGLFSFASSLQAQCEAGNPNPNVVEDTPTASFNTNAGLAIHSLTGLTWTRCSLGESWDNNTNSCTGTVQSFNWEAALNEVKQRNADNYLGFSDWRLPNLNELSSIMEHCGHYPSINQAIFPSSNSLFGSSSVAYYITSSSYTRVPSLAWSVDFNLDGASTRLKTSSAKSYMRMVRGGKLLNAYDSTLNGTGIPGDANSDGILNIQDVFFTINLISLGGFTVGADCNNSSGISITDAFCIINLISGTPPPAG